MLKKLEDVNIFANRPDIVEKAASRKIDVLENPDIEKFCLENSLYDRQIEKSMSAFFMYLNQKKRYEAAPNTAYDVELIYIREYGYAIASMITTQAMKNKKIEHETSDKLQKESIISDKKIQKATFETFKPEGERELAALQFAQEVANFYRFGKTGNTFMSGKAGTGKSHLAMAIVDYLNNTFKNDENYKTVLFASVPELFERMKESFDNPNSQYSTRRMREILSQADFLVLDDLGAETGKNIDGKVKRASDWVEKFLSMLLEARESTIITTNYSGNDLSVMYGQRLISRLLEESQGRTFIFSGMRDKRRIL